MSISPRLKHYLDDRKINYELVHHRYSDTAFNSAKHAHIPVTCMVKGVVLKDSLGYMIAVTTADKALDLGTINQQTNRAFELAPEDALDEILVDCEKGSVPALGSAFGLPIIWDDRLALQPSFYIEAGDHQKLIRLNHFDFMELLDNDQHGIISH